MSKNIKALNDIFNNDNVEPEWEDVWGAPEASSKQVQLKWIGNVDGFCDEVKRTFGNGLSCIYCEADYVQTEEGAIPIYRIHLTKNEFWNRGISELGKIKNDLSEKYNVYISDITCPSNDVDFSDIICSSDGEDDFDIGLDIENLNNDDWW